MPHPPANVAAHATREPSRGRLYRSRGKRLFDLVVVAVVLPVAGPLVLVAWCLTRLLDGGSGFFRQDRVGRDLATVRVVKIRTMCDRLPDAPAATITARGDSRVTRLGGVLRRTKIDELPQLWNVARGQMSVVGPRPDVRQWVDRFPEEFAEVLQVPPGLTGLASVAFVHEEEVLAAYAVPSDGYVREVLPRKLALDARYAQHASLALDLRILGLTVLALVRPRQAAQRAERLASRLGADPSRVDAAGIGAGQAAL